MKSNTMSILDEKCKEFGIENPLTSDKVKPIERGKGVLIKVGDDYATAYTDDTVVIIKNDKVYLDFMIREIKDEYAQILPRRVLGVHQTLFEVSLKIPVSAFILLKGNLDYKLWVIQNPLITGMRQFASLVLN